MKQKKYNVHRRFRPYVNRFNNHPYALPVTVFLVMFFVSLVMFVGLNSTTDLPTDSHIIEFSVDGKRESIPTRAQSVKEFLENVDVELGEHDRVEPELDSKIYSDKFHINVYRARPVTIEEKGGRRSFAYSAAVTPRSVVRQAGIEVYPEDIVESELPENFLKEEVIGEKVVIDRSTPANINLYGSHVPIRTHAETVADLLKEKNINVSNTDQVKPALTTKIKPNIQIFVVRPGTKLVTEQQEVPMPIEEVEDPGLSFGVSVIRQEGSPGRRVVTYQIITENGREVSRKKIQEVVSRQPVKQIVAKGKAFDLNADKASVMAAAGIRESDYPYVDFIVSHESGWRPNASNGSTWGLCQALPGSKMASAGPDWQTNPVTQLKWCNSYAAGKGGWKASYDFWQANHWW